MSDDTPPDPHDATRLAAPLRFVSLFSGVAGLDLGLSRAGHEVVAMCENWEPARRVLSTRFPDVPLVGDIQGYTPEDEYDLLTAGFPCVDLSHAGKQLGIFGPKSGLVEEVFRIVEQTEPAYVLLENVVNLLRLGRGAGIAHIVESFERLGYSWAYRVVDSRAAGVPQARRRVIVLASKAGAPENALLLEDSVPDEFAPDEAVPGSTNLAHGFYWTEGRRGVGLVRDAIPTLKGGSTIGLPSAPAIWNPEAEVGRRISLPTIEDGEALQGFPRGWTEPATVPGESDARWKLVGNAVTVGVGDWVGRALRRKSPSDAVVTGSQLEPGRPWPDAAWGGPGKTGQKSSVSHFPVRPHVPALSSVVTASLAKPLSFRATAGFISRVELSGIRVGPALTAALAEHLEAMRPAPAVMRRRQ
jgi:DNA (cytosine-5)-methyltransferase 1